MWIARLTNPCMSLIYWETIYWRWQRFEYFIVIFNHTFTPGMDEHFLKIFSITCLPVATYSDWHKCRVCVEYRAGVRMRLTSKTHWLTCCRNRNGTMTEKTPEFVPFKFRCLDICILFAFACLLLVCGILNLSYLNPLIHTYTYISI